MAAVSSCSGVVSSLLILPILIHVATNPTHARPQWRNSEWSNRAISPVAIRRLNGGDAFRGAGGQHGSCSEELCKTAGGSREGSSGDPGLRGFWSRCTCRCPKRTPIFREDLHKCTENINECSLAKFVSSVGEESKNMASQNIPLVFLPLKGQILNPSAVIKFDVPHKYDSSSSDQMVDEEYPRCSVSAAHFLTRSGWVPLSNITTDTISDHNTHLGINRKDQHGSLLYRESSTPFRIYEEKEQMYLKWLGELNMRELLAGRLVLVHLSCHIQDLEEPIQKCVGFRVAGTISLSQGIREITFAEQEVTGPDFSNGNNLSKNARNENDKESSGLSMNEWVAIAAASLFLGAIYVASVFLYLHLKKSGRNTNSEGNRGKNNGFMCGRRWERENSDFDDNNESSNPQGIIKTNPLLLLHECHQHHKRQSSRYKQSGGKSGCSNIEEKQSNDDSNDEDPHISSSVPSSPTMLKSMLQLDGLSSEEDSANNLRDKRDFHHSSPTFQQVTAAMVHSNTSSPSLIERLPEEDVSIVEAPQPCYRGSSGSLDLCLTMRNEQPDSLPPDITSDDPFVPSLFSSSPEALLAAMIGMNNSGVCDSYGQNRRKLYFNPSYFEPELLLSPPPAALEFLSKIREVISLARHRMAAKRFSPSLMGIPEADEEDMYDETDNLKLDVNNKPEPIPLGLKRENSRHSAKTRDNFVQRWLETLQSSSKSDDSLPIKVGPESAKPPPASVNKTPEAPPAPIPIKDKEIAEDAKQAMNAVIRELEVRRSVGVACKWDAKNCIYEVDSLERTKKPTIGDSLEVVMLNSVAAEIKSTEKTSPVKLYRLPELLSRPDGYSLVSEVYVNDTYNSIGSIGAEAVDVENRDVNAIVDECDEEDAGGDADITDDCETKDEVENDGEKIEEESEEEVEVKEVLTIRLEDSPSNHRRHSLVIEETFEMDTLDRKRSDESVEEESVESTGALSDECNFMDSLERPLRRISLRSSGSFRSDSLRRMGEVKACPMTSSSATDLASVLASSPLTRAYGSLREVYEARQRRRKEQKRRRSSDAATEGGFEQIRQNNLSGLPAWRLARRLPEDDINFYPYHQKSYNPIAGLTKESPLRILLSPQDRRLEQKQHTLNGAVPSLLKNHLNTRANSPKTQRSALPEMKKPTTHQAGMHNQLKFPHPQSTPKVESPAHLEYFKQDGLYTSPFCDDDDDESECEDDDEEDAKDSKIISNESLSRNSSFIPDLKLPSKDEVPMMSFFQQLQNLNQNQIPHNNGVYSVGNPKERKVINSPTTKVMRITQELQRELNRTQQRHGITGSKKPTGSFAIGEESEGGKVTKRTWRRLIEKREKERVEEEESSGEARVRVGERLESQLRRISGVDRCIMEKHSQRKELKFRLEDSGYLSSSDESAIGRVSLRKNSNSDIVETEFDEGDDMRKGDLCSDTEGESVFDGASESGAESIATDSFFGSFRVFSSPAEKAEQQQKQLQRCSSLFAEHVSNGRSCVNKPKIRHNSEEDGTDSEGGGFVKVIRNSKKNSFIKANS